MVLDHQPLLTCALAQLAGLHHLRRWGRSDRRRETHAVGRGVRTFSRSGATGDLPREAGELPTMLIVTELVEATGR